MTTAADLVEETRRHLMAGQRENLNQLSGAHDNSQTTFTFAHPLNQIQEGAYVSVDLEIVYVWSVSTAGLSATVQRGVLGTTAASHTDGTLTFANPRFPTFSIFQSINEDLYDLCSPTNGLYQVKEIDLTYNPAVQGYDLTGATDIIDILRIKHDIPGPSQLWPQIRKWNLDRNANETDFPSGFALRLYQPAWPGLQIRVSYSSSFTPFTALTSNVTTTGLAASMVDLPPLGAAMKLAGVREVQRNFNESQGDTRRASEVGTNAQVAGMRALASLRQARIRSEADKLNSSYPTRRQG